MVGNCSGESFPGGIIQGTLSGEQKSRGFHGGNCPGGIFIETLYGLLWTVLKSSCNRVVYKNYKSLSFDELVKKDRPQTLIYIFKCAPEILRKISHFIKKPKTVIKKFILHGHLGITSKIWVFSMKKVRKDQGYTRVLK